jgi:MFS family permease
VAQTDVADRLGSRFVKLWAASTTSALGAGLAAIATPLLVASRTQDPLVVSAAAVVTWVPWLLFSLPGGVLVDRVDRRRLMVTIDWVRVVVVGVLVVALVTGRLSIPLLYAVLFVVSTGEVTFRNASQAMIPAVVPSPLLERANGWLSGGTMLAQSMLAGPLAGFLYGVAASLPFLFNAGTYAASAILVGLVTGSYRASSKAFVGDPAGPPAEIDSDAVLEIGAGASVGSVIAPASRPSVRSDIIGALRWLAGQRLLRTMAVLIGLLNVTLTAALAVLVLLAKQRLHLNSVGYGLLFTCMAVGGVTGAALGDRIIKWATPTWTIRVGLLIEAGLHLVLAASHSPYLVGFAFLAFGVHGALWTIVMTTLRQRLTPPEMLGRVGSATLFVVAGGNCVGAALGGVLASWFGLAAPYWVGFVVALIVSATTWRVFDRATVQAAYGSSRF